uniref:NADH-ubiquinone oxidoreductase chain 6 n=1 Tax=Porolithon onkodes TaxID=231751 RepID=A0A2Z2KYX5_9FLOR|nr:NADH dehydrogenase subunit 6 [Porolithon onkodes]ASB29831.1 NADH dehydrogenase subunit 6 [Porolithon onkodes]
MNIDLLLFSIFSLFIFISAIMVVILSNAVHSVLFLIIVFCNVASLLLILGAEFFSFMFLIVYVGAIAVLFLFVVMMLNIKSNPMKIPFFSTLPAGFFVFFCIFNLILNSQRNYLFLDNLNYLIYTSWLIENNYLTNVEVIGRFLYTKYSLLFILCGLILLIAMIGAIVLTMHQRPTVKKQEISIQLLRNYKGVIKFVWLRK